MPKTVSGEFTYAFALTEPDSGSDAAALRTKAEIDGDYFVINGRKQFISGFDIADHALVALRTSQQAKKQMGISTLLIDTKTPGIEAKRMIGRTPGHIQAIRPLKDGVIADFQVTEHLLRAFVQRVQKHKFLVRPRIIICVPSGITEVEKRAVIDSAVRAGCREVLLVPEPIAAAIGFLAHLCCHGTRISVPLLIRLLVILLEVALLGWILVIARLWGQF